MAKNHGGIDHKPSDISMDKVVDIGTTNPHRLHSDLHLWKSEKTELFLMFAWSLFLFTLPGVWLEKGFYCQGRESLLTERWLG